MKTLVKTCSACPEQYDVLDEDGVEVGYLRLRHGYFAAYENVMDNEPVYSAYTVGDGMFDDDAERMHHLSNAMLALYGDDEFAIMEREYDFG